MAYPTAAGVTSLSGTYIPQLFAAKLIVEFYISTVFGNITTTDYEGQIKQMGDSVTISGLPNISSKPYVAGQKLEHDDLNPDSVELLINKGQYYGFKVKNIDKVQSHIDDFASKWATHAGMAQSIEIDRIILADIYASAHASNAGATAGKKSGDINLGVSGTPLPVTASTIIATIINCGVVLDEQNVPPTDRWIILPAWACGLLKQSDIKDASVTGDTVSPLRNGRVGMVNGMEVYMSNNIASAVDGDKTAYNAMFGWKGAVTFASQLTENRIMETESDFAHIMDGLQVFGYEVIKPEGLGHLYIEKG